MGEPILKIQNVSKTFGNRIKAVQDLDLNVEEGDVFGFLGPNGAGKTTTIRLILGLLRPDSGEIYIKNHAVETDRYAALRHVGALVEGPAFYEYLSAGENLKIFASYSGSVPPTRIDEVLKLVDLTGRKGDKVKTFSMGMKQRLGIAQALLNNPEVIILDEPTNGLDPHGVLEIRRLLKELSKKKGVTIFLSSHILSEVELICDKVAIINRGKLMAQGQVDDLLNRHRKVYVAAGPDNGHLSSILKSIAGISLVKGKDILFNLGENKPEDVLTRLIEKGAKVHTYHPHRIKLEDFFFEVVDGSTA